MTLDRRCSRRSPFTLCDRWFGTEHEARTAEAMEAVKRQRRAKLAGV